MVLSSSTETLYAPFTEFIQEVAGPLLTALDGFFPFTSVALVLFLVLLSTSIFDMTQKEFWIDAKLILLKNIFKLICVGLFMSGYLTLTLLILTLWFIVDKYMDYSFLHRIALQRRKDKECKRRASDKI